MGHPVQYDYFLFVFDDLVIDEMTIAKYSRQNMILNVNLSDKTKQ